MLKASPSSSAPAGCSGLEVTCLFCMQRMRPTLTASAKLARSASGTCVCVKQQRRRKDGCVRGESQLGQPGRPRASPHLRLYRLQQVALHLAARHAGQLLARVVDQAAHLQVVAGNKAGSSKRQAPTSRHDRSRPPPYTHCTALRSTALAPHLAARMPARTHPPRSC